MKREHDRQIDPSEPVVCPHHGRGRDATLVADERHAHDRPKIQMPVLEAKDHTIRGLALDRKNPDPVGGAGAARFGSLQTQRRHDSPERNDSRPA